MRALILAIISGVKAASPSLSRLARKYSSKGSSQGKRDGDEERDDDTDREDGERERERERARAWASRRRYFLLKSSMCFRTASPHPLGLLLSVVA